MTSFNKLCCVVLASCGLFACSNELKGELSVDGKTFALDSCRSGQIYGFVGVEIVSKDGAKIRIKQTPTGESLAYYLPSGSATGVELGKCGSFSVSRQSSTINDVQNVEGQAVMECEAGGHKVAGNFTFSNCH